MGTLTARGYVRIEIDGVPQYAHRLAWLYVHGKWPRWQIDHMNCDQGDNRLCNLRDIPQADNAQNERRARPNNKSCGLLGVTKCKNSDRYFSRITVGRKVKYLGCFSDANAAHVAYVQAKRIYHQASTL